MNIKQLEVFVAIAETGSFSKGAEAACITQSTASQHVAALESSAGIRLLDRTGRGAIVTEAGKVLLDRARLALAAMRNTEQAIRQFRQADDVELHIAGSSIPGTYLLPQVVASLRLKAPGITVFSTIRDSGDALDLLRNGAVELAVVGIPPDDPAFETECAGHDTLRLVVRSDHKWHRLTSINFRDLTTEPLVAREAGSGTGRTVIEQLRRAGFDGRKLKIGAIFSTSEAVKHAVLAGCGGAFLSEAAVAGEVTRGELIPLDIDGIDFTRTFSLVWRRGRSLSPAAEMFRTAIRERVRETGAQG